MATNPNMKAIETVTVPSGGQPSIIFNNIPQTYTDLVILLSARTDRTGANIDGVYPFFNNDTIVGNYSGRRIIGNGSTATSNTYTGVITAANDLTTYAFGNAIIYIPNYRSANNKSFTVDAVNENNATIAYTTLSALLWNNTAPISTITLRTEDGVSKLLQHSTATLYGITSAGYGAYATGGVITSDASYYYHTFLASGTFTPTQALTADCLVIAGGGGSGRNNMTNNNPGAGAGGYRLLASQSLTTTAYTVQVGGGGVGATSDTSPGAKGGNSYLSGSGFTTITSTGGGYSHPISTSGTGGSGGGGASHNNQTGAAGNEGGYTPVEGYAGGSGNDGTNFPAGGGGGAGGIGGSGSSGSAGGNGGVGSSTASSWGLVTGTGQNVSGTVYYAGGGGGGAAVTGGAGGYGGGGAGSSNLATNNGLSNTGGGAGGSGGTPGQKNGANGGSGIVIIRYLK